ncbi:3-hydroxybenzoate 6-hydroxylase 1 [Corynebacterium occultum]|uniref:3-hydroxybenzoate 6-hydroxylase 1 n=1 Tax=Corynebacterium occultum TaxID=2675219 RepID=A0A6B8WC44_9CORY|nr:FAD-dependent monooxygenase [Corynebacterium occultum]QGU08446.1 3-hydroxybenzoate 6-hydroxylase 1 [Corynebacterium occultum]
MTTISATGQGTRIAIVGAGIGGLTLAVELRRRGLEPQVFEQAAELREVGAAVALSANAVRFLRDRIGIGEQLAEKAADVDGLIFRDGRDGRVLGRVLSRSEYHERAGAPYYGVHRADLQQMLKEALGEEGLHLNKKCVRVEDGPQSAVLHFADGDSFEADLVIGADGIRSQLRKEILGYDDAQFSGCHGWRGMVPPEQVPSLPDPEAIQFWMGPGGHLLHYPIGNGEQNFLLVRRHDGPWADKSWVVPAEKDEHLAAFEGWDPAFIEMISAAPATERWALFHRPPLHQWSRGRITLLGDAAHAMVPHHGQGANQSIEDAIVLADCLMEGLEQGSGWDAARQRYQDIREGRARRVQITSLATADMLHLPDGPLAQERNARLGSPQVWDRSLAWIHEHVADRQLSPAGI